MLEIRLASAAKNRRSFQLFGLSDLGAKAVNSKISQVTKNANGERLRT